MIKLLPLALCLLAACASPATRPAEFSHSFVYLRLGRERSAIPAERLNELMAGHMANIGRLAEAGELYVAGPFGTPNPTPELRGIFIFRTDDVARAAELTATDPAVAAGAIASEVVPWSTDKDLSVVQRRDREFDARRRADPSIDMMQGMSSYVALLVEDAARASRALAPLRQRGKIALEGRFGGARAGQAFVVLDTRDPTAAEALLGSSKAELGPHTMIPWWGSAEIAR